MILIKSHQETVNSNRKSFNLKLCSNNRICGVFKRTTKKIPIWNCYKREFKWSRVAIVSIWNAWCNDLIIEVVAWEHFGPLCFCWDALKNYINLSERNKFEKFFVFYHFASSLHLFRYEKKHVFQNEKRNKKIEFRRDPSFHFLKIRNWFVII